MTACLVLMFSCLSSYKLWVETSDRLIANWETLSEWIDFSFMQKIKFYFDDADYSSWCQVLFWVVLRRGIRVFSLLCSWVAKNFLVILVKLLLYRFLALGFWGIMCILPVLLLLNLLWWVRFSEYAWVITQSMLIPTVRFICFWVYKQQATWQYTICLSKVDMLFLSD